MIKSLNDKAETENVTKWCSTACCVQNDFGSSYLKCNLLGKTCSLFDGSFFGSVCETKAIIGNK